MADEKTLAELLRGEDDRQESIRRSEELAKSIRIVSGDKGAEDFRVALKDHAADEKSPEMQKFYAATRNHLREATAEQREEIFHAAKVLDVPVNNGAKGTAEQGLRQFLSNLDTVREARANNDMATVSSATHDGMTGFGFFQVQMHKIESAVENHTLFKGEGIAAAIAAAEPAQATASLSSLIGDDMAKNITAIAGKEGANALAEALTANAPNQQNINEFRQREMDKFYAIANNHLADLSKATGRDAEKTAAIAAAGALDDTHKLPGNGTPGGAEKGLRQFFAEPDPNSAAANTDLNGLRTRADAVIRQALQDKLRHPEGIHPHPPEAAHAPAKEQTYVAAAAPMQPSPYPSAAGAKGVKTFDPVKTAQALASVDMNKIDPTLMANMKEAAGLLGTADGVKQYGELAAWYQRELQEAQKAALAQLNGNPPAAGGPQPAVAASNSPVTTEKPADMAEQQNIRKLYQEALQTSSNSSLQQRQAIVAEMQHAMAEKDPAKKQNELMGITQESMTLNKTLAAGNEQMEKAFSVLFADKSHTTVTNNPFQAFNDAVEKGGVVVTRNEKNEVVLAIAKSVGSNETQIATFKLGNGGASPDTVQTFHESLQQAANDLAKSAGIKVPQTAERSK